MLRRVHALASTLSSPEWVRRASLTIVVLGWILGVALVIERWWRDGSLWLDEASIAMNLLLMDPNELFGPLKTQHSFPRLYLFTIASLQEALGYHTLVLRALPVVAFAGGAALWGRLLWLRFRERPALLLLGVAMSLMATTWLNYGAMVKQYSLDLLLALVPFVLSDDFFEARLRRGQRRWLLIPVVALTIVSYTYVIPLLGRVIGWAVSTGRRTGPVLDPAGVATFVVALGAALATLYGIELRHTAELGGLFGFWSDFILSGQPLHDLGLVTHLYLGWFDVLLVDAPPLSPGVWPPVAWVCAGCFLLGIGSVTRRGAERSSPAEAALQRWGSRSAGAVVTVVGLVLAGYAVRYPIASGRLSLFVLPMLHLLTLEGIVSIGEAIKRLPQARVIRALLWLLLFAPIAFRVGQTADALLTEPLYEDFRPHLSAIEQGPVGLPIVVSNCSTRQVASLPEWQGRRDLVWIRNAAEKARFEAETPTQFWLVDLGVIAECPRFAREISRRATTMALVGSPSGSARLWYVKLREPRRLEER